MSVRFEWNGRNAEDAINKALFGQVRENVQKRLWAARCPEHHTGPTLVTVSGHDLDSLAWHAQGCCERLIDGMREALS